MKVFLAGAEESKWARLLNFMQYPFRLLSYFGLVGGPRSKKREIALALACDNNPGLECIMDSGLYSFMFGSHQGKLTTYDDYKRYAETYVSDIIKWGYKDRIVECDIQRVLGQDECNQLRDEVFRQCGLPVIYVWHIPDRWDGLREIAARERHIAISIPELRLLQDKIGSPRQVVLECFRVIRASGGNPTVHLLGNTEMALMSLPGDTCDSTSWIAAGKFGDGQVYCFDSKTLKKVSVYSPKWKAWRRYCEKAYGDGLELVRQHCTSGTQASEDYYVNVACNAISYFLYMESNHGESKRPERRPDPVG